MNKNLKRLQDIIQNANNLHIFDSAHYNQQYVYSSHASSILKIYNEFFDELENMVSDDKDTKEFIFIIKSFFTEIFADLQYQHRGIKDDQYIQIDPKTIELSFRLVKKLLKKSFFALEFLKKNNKELIDIDVILAEPI